MRMGGIAPWLLGGIDAPVCNSPKRLTSSKLDKLSEVSWLTKIEMSYYNNNNTKDNLYGAVIIT